MGHSLAIASDKIRADIFLRVAAANGHHEDGVLGIRLTDFQPRLEHRRPAFVVRACGEFGDIIARAVGFNAGELAEIIHRVAAVARTATNAKKE